MTLKPALLILLACSIALYSSHVITGSGANAAGPGEGRDAHFRISNPAQLGPERAEEIYQSIRMRMAEDYSESADPIVRQYQRWVRLNRFPYASAGHGRVFVNNYANPTAADRFAARDRSDSYPVGSIVIKDGFIATDAGDILTAPLNIIEKRAPGQDATTDEGWRFIQITPDGMVIGAALQDERTRFCANCHLRYNAPVAPFFFVPVGKESQAP